MLIERILRKSTWVIREIKIKVKIQKADSMMNRLFVFGV